MVPEEHSSQAPKQLISLWNPKWKIAKTITSTNKSFGKGRISADNAA
jgi:hypothetical protein